MHERKTESFASDFSLGTPEEQHHSTRNDLPPPLKRQRLSIEWPNNNVTAAVPTLHPAIPGAPSYLPPQNRPMWMMPPPSPAPNGGDKGQNGSKDVWIEDAGCNSLDNLGQTSSAGSTATSPPPPGVTGTSAPGLLPTTTNSAPNTGITPYMPSTSDPPLNSGPMANQQTVPSNTALLQNFIQQSSNSSNDFLNMGNGDLNFERDFGQWFDGDDLPLDMKNVPYNSTPYELSNSLNDFDTNVFLDTANINFERDFGRWFNGDDISLDMNRGSRNLTSHAESQRPALHPESMFKSAVRGYTSPLTTLREFKMMGLMNTMSDKNDWQKKVFDDLPGPGVMGANTPDPQLPPTTNGVPNTAIAPSLPSISGTLLHPGPVANKQTELYDTTLPTNFTPQLSDSLNDLDTNMDNGDINFERDFGQWFNEGVFDTNIILDFGDFGFEPDFGQWFNEDDVLLDATSVPNNPTPHVEPPNPAPNVESQKPTPHVESQTPALHTELMFKSVLRGYTSPLTTLREFKMVAAMNAMSDICDWHKKVFDDQITKKWKKELIEGDQGVTEAMVDWCIEELRYRSKGFELTGFMTAYDADVVKSDTGVPEDLKAALVTAVRPLEDIRTVKKDWQPDSGGRVLDLVDPSLFPLVYGFSRVLTHSVTNLDDCIKRCGEGMDIAFCGDETLDDGYSNKFQWLPCDVDISGNLPKITSYINNLHPHHHKDLYSVIEKIIGCAIPLWNAALTTQRTYPLPRIMIDEVKMPKRPLRQKGESSEDWWARFENRLQSVEAEQPEVEHFTPDRLPAHLRRDDEPMDPDDIVDLKKDYACGGLQVIVKLANIHLTPEKPEYEGGSWRMEGQLNEHICATAIYYYDSENVSGSFLAFRQIVDPDDTCHILYERRYYRWLTDIFGCHNEEAAIQYIGSVGTREGRLLAFPNIIQHKTQPFELTDPTKPGHLKILMLFLVDPNIRIVSTANVPCQRLDWWREALETREVLQGLPLELKDLVYDLVDFPMSMQMAKELRVELMEERKNFTAEFESFLEPFWLA